MHFCFRKFHPRRLPGLIAWLAVVILIFHQLSIITVSIQVHPPKFSRPRDLAFKYRNETREPANAHIPEAVGIFTEENVKLVRGKFRTTKGFLTIGLCTVPRPGAFYLPSTLETLTSNLTREEQQTTVIVIYLGSYDNAWINQVLNLIDDKYAKAVASGMIQVVKPDPQIYPDFNNLTRRTYGDSTDRIIWRTKQNIDYAYLFSYSRGISEYYIHIEDDVTAVLHYLYKIKSFVDMRNENDDLWFCLEFSRQGFIGKLFHSDHLPRMKDYFLMFQFEKPGDLLLNDLKSAMAQTRDIYSTTTVFRHIGRQSSLTNKTHVIREGMFKKGIGYRIKPFGRTFNPPAKIQTSMMPYPNHKPEDAYDIISHKTFWAKDIKAGDIYEIILREKGRLKGATISTGHPIRKTYKLRSAVLKYGTSLDGDGSCKTKATIGTLKDGYVHFSAFTSLEIKCLVLYVTQKQIGHAIISKTNKLRSAVLKYGTSLDGDGSCKTKATIGTLKDGYEHFSAFTSLEIKCLVLYVTQKQIGHAIISKTNKLRSAVLKYGTSLDGDGSCKTKATIGTLKDGYVHFSAFTSLEIKCLVLHVTQKQIGHAIISKIVLAF